MLVLTTTVIECVYISAFASLVGIFVSIASSAVGIKNFAITAVMKKYKSAVTKTKSKHDKIVYC